MPAEYDVSIKAGRMAVPRDAANGGWLEVVNEAGDVLYRVPLESPSGVVVGPVWTLSGFPKVAAALLPSTVEAPARSARIRTAANTDVRRGMSLGLAGSGATVILDSLHWKAGDVITVKANPTVTHAP